MALHSCSTTLGIAIIDSRSTQTTLKSSTFPIGRNLSKNIIDCVEELLPSSHWGQLGRLAVAIGPGGFTSTRVTVAMARALAQQLDCDLDGISNFALMAPRLSSCLANIKKQKPFWIIKNLPRRGTVGGKYQIKKCPGLNDLEIGIELEKPHLLESSSNFEPSINASDNVNIDVVQLLRISLLAKTENKQNPWQNVLPIYPTSPVK